MKMMFNIEFQDGNGFIDRRELGLMMRFMGERLTEEEIQVQERNNSRVTSVPVNVHPGVFYPKVTFQMIIDEADSDKDGFIDYTEFYNSFK